LRVPHALSERHINFGQTIGSSGAAHWTTGIPTSFGFSSAYSHSFRRLVPIIVGDVPVNYFTLCLSGVNNLNVAKLMALKMIAIS
jgi:hypothetical protein